MSGFGGARFAALGRGYGTVRGLGVRLDWGVG